MTMTINLSPELQKALEELAETNRVPVDEIIEAILLNYMLDNYSVEGYDPPSDEEIEAVKQAYEEAHKPGAVWYDLDEVVEELLSKINKGD